MPVYFIQGTLGSGKGLCTVARIKEYLLQGRKVATNMDIQSEHLLGRFDKTANLMRLPDIPTKEHFDQIGIGKPENEPTDKMNGGIFLDECGVWFNSRDYRDPDRKARIDWLRNARKLGWDVYIQIQHFESIDKQLRSEILEFLVTCMRTDRTQIPFISGIYRMIARSPMPMPQMHVASVINYKSDTKFDNWYASPKELGKAYDTNQVYLEDNLALPEESGVSGTYCYITPYQKIGRKFNKNTRVWSMQRAHLYIRRLQIAIGFAAGLVSAALVAVGWLAFSNSQPIEEVELDTESKPIHEVVSFAYSFNRLHLVSMISIEKNTPNAPKIKDHEILYTDPATRIQYTLQQLLSAGYKHRIYSDCYQEFINNQGTIIPVTCSPQRQSVDQAQT